MSVDPWLLPEVARAQRSLVEKQLRNVEGVAPFVAFIDALMTIPHAGDVTLLDLGCGVGHYAALVQRYFSHVRYVGYDYSPAMIHEARELNPQGEFHVRGFDQANAEDFDIVLAGQVIEYTQNPRESLAGLCNFRRRQYLILHRLRVVPGASHRTPPEDTYCGHQMPNYEWNANDLQSIVAAHNKILSTHTWGNYTTLVLEAIR